MRQARVARMLDRSPSVIRGEIKRNTGADGRYRGGEAESVAARRPARPTRSAGALRPGAGEMGREGHGN